MKTDETKSQKKQVKNESETWADGVTLKTKEGYLISGDWKEK